MSKIKNSGLDQYGTEPFELQQFGTAGVEGVKSIHKFIKPIVERWPIDEKLLPPQYSQRVNAIAFDPLAMIN